MHKLLQRDTMHQLLHNLYEQIHLAFQFLDLDSKAVVAGALVD